MDAVRERWLKVLDDLERALDHPNSPKRETTGLMKQWGALLVETSQRAFLEQKLGEWEWPPRYPGMADPFINIAGSLEDFNKGKANPKPNRFENIPALVDRGMAGGMWGSITYAAGKDSTEVGTNKDYAKLHQEGGETYIKVSETGYRLGRNWLFDKKGNARKGREGYVPKLWPSLFRRSLTQNVAKRPFLGITEEAAQDMIHTTSDYFEKEAGLGGGRWAAAV